MVMSDNTEEVGSEKASPNRQLVRNTDSPAASGHVVMKEKAALGMLA